MITLLISVAAFALVAAALSLVAVWYAHRRQRSLARLQESLTKWTDALERQAIEMKDWHRRLVDRETALLEREHERQQDFEQWLDGA